MDTGTPTLTNDAISADGTQITMTFDRNIVDATLGTLKNSISFSSDGGTNYNALGGSDSVSISGSELQITFASPLAGSQNKIKVNANAIKDTFGNVKTDVTETNNLGNSYTVTLSQTGTYTFAGLTQGYAAVTPFSINVNNTGTGNIASLAVALSGSNASSFTLGTLVTALNGGQTTSFTIKPNDGLAAGSYSATVTVTADHSLTNSFNVTFTVNSVITPITPTTPASTPTTVTGSIVDGKTGEKVKGIEAQVTTAADAQRP